MPASCAVSNSGHQPQQATILVSAQKTSNEVTAQKLKYQKTLRGLAIAEVIIGVICFILGAVTSGIVGAAISRRNRFQYYGYRHYRCYYSLYSFQCFFTTGEGIWCGIWIIIAGVLGIRAAKFNASRCLTNTHLAFSIIAAVTSSALVILGGIGASIGGAVLSLVITNCLVCIAGLASMILNILSASFSCAALGCCSEQNNNEFWGCGEQVVYNPRPVVGNNGIVYTQQPTLLYQGPSNPQQGSISRSSQFVAQTTVNKSALAPTVDHLKV